MFLLLLLRKRGRVVFLFVCVFSCYNLLPVIKAQKTMYMLSKYSRTEIYIGEIKSMYLCAELFLFLNSKINLGCTFGLYILMKALTLEMCLPYVLLETDNPARTDTGKQGNKQTNRNLTNCLIFFICRFEVELL